MKWGLVVGKFSPLHLGHDHLIRFAKDRVDRLMVLSWSDPEYPGCSAERRAAWLRELHPDVCSVVVRGGRGPFQAIHWPRSWGPFAGDGKNPLPSLGAPPQASDSESISREYTAVVFQTVAGRPCDAVFTSESYGGPWADHLSRFWQNLGHNDCRVSHFSVDPGRSTFPVSGSAARLAPLAHRHLMPDRVFQDQILRVAFLGGESTGKTTLAKAMAETLGTCWAPEYGRELWEGQGGHLSFEDLSTIARVQVDREQELMAKSKRYLFCDSTPLTTRFYSEAMFNRVAEEVQVASRRPYDHLFLCGDEFPFVQDGTRQDAEFRTRQQHWYRQELLRNGVAFSELAGSLSERVLSVQKILAQATHS